MMFWACKRIDGTIHVHRCDELTVEDAEQDPYVTDTWGPYSALGYMEARAEAEQILGDNNI